MASVRTATVAVLALNSLSWVVLLGGNASLTAFCNSNHFGKCGVRGALQWWVTMFQLLIVVLAWLAGSRPALRTIALHFTTSCTAIMMWLANNTYARLTDTLDAVADCNTLAQYTGISCSDYHTRLEAYLAGLVMSMTLNFSWVICASLASASEAGPKAAALSGSSA